MVLATCLSVLVDLPGLRVIVMHILNNACLSNILLILVNLSYVVERRKMMRVRMARLLMEGWLDHLVMADLGLVLVVLV